MGGRSGQAVLAKGGVAEEASVVFGESKISLADMPRHFESGFGRFEAGRSG